ncbi:Imm47 family immunity protein [Paenibacillus sp. 8b26]|uniref:Imm47 family immunity protein n=1 Tax=Paenibacillus sp. 8b26 TaxID=3424133 RepID=UPI003D65E1B5
MNDIWFGKAPSVDSSVIKQNILKAQTERDVIFNLIELFKLGDLTQKTLLIQLMNQTKDEAVLNLCIRVFCSISTHDDLRDSNNLIFLGEATEDAVNTFASAAITSLSLDVVPYLLSLLDDWDEINETSTIIRDSIDFFINFENQLGDEATVDEIGEYYLNYTKDCDTDKYYFDQKLSFPGDLAKKLIERIMIAANHELPLQMELIPSLLSIWSGEKVPGDYNTVINSTNYKDFINYIEGLSKKNWEKGQKYFYGHTL